MGSGLSQADLAGIDKVLTECVRALEVNDVDAWLMCWTEDAVVMPAGLPEVRGHVQLREYRELRGGRKNVLSDIRIDGRGDLAVVMTAFTTVRANDSANGKQLLTLRKQVDGRWLIAAVCFNMDVPGEM